jgi:hypothetical protein
MAEPGQPVQRAGRADQVTDLLAEIGRPRKLDTGSRQVACSGRRPRPGLQQVGLGQQKRRAMAYACAPCDI